MKYLRILLAFLLIFAIGSPCFADTIAERGASYNKYQVDSDTYRLEVGGDNENALPFDGGPYQPWDLVFANGTPVGNWTWLGKGTQGYLVKPSTSTVRIYPVRGNQSKYIEIAPISAQPSLVNQISNKHLELYVDQANTRWSLHMTPQGFKPEILLKSGWSGTPEWQFRFELNGLTLSGANIMDGDTAVLSLFAPFIADANGNVFPVSESVSNGIATLTADMTGVKLPAVVDPTVGPINPAMDTFLVQSTPTTGYGQRANINMISLTGNANQRAAWQFDASAAPPGSVVSSANLTIVIYNVGNTSGINWSTYRITRTDWEEGGDGTPDEEANWNNYKNPNVAWTTAGGDIDATVTNGPYTEDGTTGTKNYSVLNIAQDAINNRSGIVSILGKWDTENDATQRTIQSRSLQYGTAADRPTLTIVYTVPSAGGVTSTHLGYPQMVF